jgi:DeoR family transcriptional regulator of aga operon
LNDKAKLHHREKQRIAIAAAAMVKDGDCVILDSGTTTTAIARALRCRTKLTVITNAINIAAELADTEFEIILTGGTLRRNSVSLVGPLAEETLKDMHADILFLGADGLDFQAGITTPNVLESRVGRAMVAAARIVVVACDSSKLGRRSLALISPLNRIHRLITDKNAASVDIATFRESGLEVHLV